MAIRPADPPAPNRLERGEPGRPTGICGGFTIVFSARVSRVIKIRWLCAVFGQASYGCTWTGEEAAHRLVGDVGYLVKLVMARGGIRRSAWLW